MRESRNLSAVGSEAWSRAALGYMALLLLPTFVMLAAIAAKWGGLDTTVGLENAQLARHLAEGKGFVTYSIRPLALVFEDDLKTHADLYYPPLYPLTVSLFFRALHVGDRVMAAVGGILWILSVWLTYWVARQWFGSGIAGLATLFYGLNVVGIMGAISGLPYPLMSLLVLLAVWLVFPMPKGVLWLGPGDLKDAVGLVAKLRRSADPVSSYLWSLLSPDLQQRLIALGDSESMPDELKQELLAELNRVIGEEELYERERFSQIVLSSRTSRLVRQNPQGDAVSWLNRYLLEDAYPQEIRGQAESQRSRPDLRWHDEAFAEELPDWRLWLTGAVCGLAVLTHHLLLVLAVVVCIFLGLTQRRGARAMGLFLIGALVVCLPWMWRSFRLVGSPFFSLFWYETLANTSVHPGESLWRTTTPPPHPLWFMVSNPAAMLRKLMEGMDRSWALIPGVLNLAVGSLFVVAWMVSRGGWRWRGLLGCVLAGVVMATVGSVLTRLEPGLLVAWTPLISIVAAAYFTDWLTQRLGLSRRGHRSEPEASEEEVAHEKEAGRANPWGRALAYLVCVVLTGIPFFSFMALYQPRPNPMVRQVTALQRRVAPGGVVLTDQPAMVAWYADRPALWLAAGEEDLDRIERLGPLDASYITGAYLQIRAQEKVGDWWIWIGSPMGIYRDLAPADRMPSGAILRLRSGTAGGSAAAPGQAPGAAKGQ